MLNERHMIWAAWLSQQRHACLFGRPIAFRVVALDASTNEILPRILSGARTWNDMVDCEWKISSSTKLTTVAVAAENILSGDDDLLIRDADIDGESHDARKWHRHGDRAEQLAGVSFDQFCLS